MVVGHLILIVTPLIVHATLDSQAKSKLISGHLARLLCDQCNVNMEGPFIRLLTEFCHGWIHERGQVTWYIEPGRRTYFTRFLSEGAHTDHQIPITSKSLVSLASNYGGEINPCGADLRINPMGGRYPSLSWTQVAVTPFSSMETPQFFSVSGKT